MTTPRRILVPYDFTGPSKRACDYATELAAAIGARLCLLHVLERFGIPLTMAEHASLTAAVENELERAAALIRPIIPRVETRLVEGSPWEGIEAVARDSGADLIVMGTHGRRGLARALLGSVAARALRTSNVPVTTVPEYVAVSRGSAGVRLAAALEPLALRSPNVIALSRGALTVSTALSERVDGSVDLWAVEPILGKDGAVIGAIGEDGAILYDPGAGVIDAGREEAVATARRRLASELVGLKGARSIGECWQRDVVLVADGLFSSAFADVAIGAIRSLGPRRIIVASPIVSRDLVKDLEKKVDAVVTLETGLVTDACVYRDDVMPSDVVAYELILAPHAHPAS